MSGNAKGIRIETDSFTCERREFADEKTGRTVWQVTDGEFECMAPYVESPAWSSDNRFIFFMCNRTGSWQPYRMELDTGEAEQLVVVEGAHHHSLGYEPTSNELYVQNRYQLLAVDMATLESRLAVDFERDLPEGWEVRGMRARMSSDGFLATVSCRTDKDEGGMLVSSTDGGSVYEAIRLVPGDIEAGHMQFRPGDNNYLSCCRPGKRQNDPNELPFYRTREYHVDRLTGKLTPLVLMPPGFRATHCTWGRSGARMYAHRKTVPTWVPTAVISVNAKGEDLKVHYETDKYMLGHSQASLDEKWMAVDSQEPDENILMLLNMETGQDHLLCWPNNSINDKTKRPSRRNPDLPPAVHLHTHPGFSPNGRFIHYTSDVSGRSHVYVVPVGDLVG